MLKKYIISMQTSKKSYVNTKRDTWSKDKTQAKLYLRKKAEKEIKRYKALYKDAENISIKYTKVR